MDTKSSDYLEQGDASKPSEGPSSPKRQKTDTDTEAKSEKTPIKENGPDANSEVSTPKKSEQAAQVNKESKASGDNEHGDASKTDTDTEAKSVTTPVKENGPDANSEVSSPKKSEQTAQVNEESKASGGNDKPDGVYLHRPEPGKQQQRVNQPENEGLCMDIIYATVSCMDNCNIL